MFGRGDPVVCEAQPSAQSKCVYSPTEAGEPPHVAVVKNHMYMLCWTEVCNTCYSSN